MYGFSLRLPLILVYTVEVRRGDIHINENVGLRCSAHIYLTDTSMSVVQEMVAVKNGQRGWRIDADLSFTGCFWSRRLKGLLERHARALLYLGLIYYCVLDWGSSECSLKRNGLCAGT